MIALELVHDGSQYFVEMPRSLLTDHRTDYKTTGHGQNSVRGRHDDCVVANDVVDNLLNTQHSGDVNGTLDNLDIGHRYS